MIKFIDFIKRHSWVLILIIVIISIIGDAIITKVQKPAPSPTPIAQAATFKSITPGVSSEADLNKVLGTPVKTTISGNKKTDQYKSTSELRLHTAIIENGVVVLIKEIVSAHDTATASDITSVYGTAPDILYYNYPNAAFELYVYPANGIAYIGASDGTLLEIWYFQPTTIDNFTSKWAQGFSSSPSNFHSQ